MKGACVVIVLGLLGLAGVHGFVTGNGLRNPSHDLRYSFCMKSSQHHPTLLRQTPNDSSSLLTKLTPPHVHRSLSPFSAGGVSAGKEFLSLHYWMMLKIFWSGEEKN